MTDQYFPLKSDTSKKLRKNHNVRAIKALQRSGEMALNPHFFITPPQSRNGQPFPKWSQNDVYDDLLSKDELERSIVEQDKSAEDDYKYYHYEMAPSRFLEGEMMEVTLDELPVRWRRSNRQY
jgi:hypothetical protein